MNDKFLEVLRDAMAEILGSAHDLLRKPRVASDINPLFAAVRGAVHYARIRQEAPFGCVDSKQCEVERQV